MTAAVATGRRFLPRGYLDFARQLLIWFGFLLAYQLARGVADRDPARAFANGWKVIGIEERLAGLGELTLQGWTQSSRFLETLVSWTYWNSEFTVVGLALLWVYIRRHDAFFEFRNSILFANVIGLLGYVIVPMAPPRMLGVGFPDSHHDGLIQLAANPYAAMPSLHACDSLIVGVVLASLSRHWWAKAFWMVWPAWVWFAVMASGNHFWLDCVAGAGVAMIAMSAVYRRDVFRVLAVRRT
jgi:hypothetical protein